MSAGKSIRAGRSINKRVWIGSGVSLILAVALQPSSVLAAGCRYDAGAATVAVSVGPGEDATLSVVEGEIHFNGAPCEAATVTNTDSIEVTGSNGAEHVTVDLATGPFAPGRSPEADTPEIEMTIDLVEDLKKDIVTLAGTESSDNFQVGANGTNLNSDGDADVVIANSAIIETVTRGGDDSVDGSPGSLGGSSLTRLVAYGGEGDDTLAGSDFVDSLLGEGGADVLFSGAYTFGLREDDAPSNYGGWNDFLTGGRGADTMNGGNGKDHFDMGGSLEEDGSGDVVRGGGGFDVLSHERTNSLNITLDGQANDGEPGENDNVGSDVERIYGTVQNDVIDAGGSAATPAASHYEFFGMEGNDRLIGSDGTDVLIGSGLEGPNVPYPPGTPDDDFLDGRGGHDYLQGGNGSDIELGGEGDDRFDHSGIGVQRDGKRDVLDGGNGRDRAEYRRGTKNMYIALNNIPDDGEYFEEDNIKDTVEEIYTGDGHDIILGFGDIDNTLVGGTWGDDEIRGGGGSDRIVGGRADDTLDGGGGNDTILSGQGGADLVTGGAGDDRIDDSPDRSVYQPWEQPVPGESRLIGDEGDDCIKARDGASDMVDGGMGRDVATLDRVDRHKRVRPVDDC